MEWRNVFPPPPIFLVLTAQNQISFPSITTSSLSVYSISQQPCPPLSRPDPLEEMLERFLLYLAGQWLFEAVHQGKTWQLGDRKGKEECHQLAKERQTSASKRGHQSQRVPILQQLARLLLTSTFFLFVYALFLITQAVFAHLCTMCNVCTFFVYFRLCTLWHFQARSPWLVLGSVA